jgi:hypothetical protein
MQFAVGAGAPAPPEADAVPLSGTARFGDRLTELVVTTAPLGPGVVLL